MRGVYAITNVLSDVVYYGQATQMHVRLGQHKSDLSHGRHRNPHLQASWNKYGADAFVFAAQYVIPDGDMTAREKFCIDGAYGLGLRLFNMRVAEPGSMAGYKHSNATRAKWSLARLGRKHTPEHCARIAESLLGNKNGLGNRSHLGLKHTPASRAKMSASRLGKPHPRRARLKTKELVGVPNGKFNR